MTRITALLASLALAIAALVGTQTTAHATDVAYVQAPTTSGCDLATVTVHVPDGVTASTSSQALLSDGQQYREFTDGEQFTLSSNYHVYIEFYPQAGYQFDVAQLRQQGIDGTENDALWGYQPPRCPTAKAPSSTTTKATRYSDYQWTVTVTVSVGGAGQLVYLQTMRDGRWTGVGRARVGTNTPALFVLNDRSPSNQYRAWAAGTPTTRPAMSAVFRLPE